jgi:hypothetical protein
VDRGRLRRGGNTSAKGNVADPVTGEQVELLWVKGSGGDLGTLTPNGLAVLRVDRLHALVGVYPGVELRRHEGDESSPGPARGDPPAWEAGGHAPRGHGGRM